MRLGSPYQKRARIRLPWPFRPAPLVSVIVPVYNCETLLAQCLNSLVGQTCRDIEILVIDDGSTDQSLQVIQSYADRDPRIRVFQKENGGQGSARNVGIDAACGKFIGFLDADDWAVPHMFESLVSRALEAKADIVACEFYNFYQDTGRYGFFKFRTGNKPVFGKSVKKNPDLYFAVGNYLPNKIFHRRLFRNRHIRLPENQIFEDSWIMPDLLARANRIEGVQERLFFYRRVQNETSTSKFDSDRFLGVFKSADKIVEHFDRYAPGSIAQRRVLSQLLATLFFSRFDVVLRGSKSCERNQAGSIDYMNRTFDYLEKVVPDWQKHYSVPESKLTEPRMIARTGRDSAIKLARMDAGEFDTFLAQQETERIKQAEIRRLALLDRQTKLYGEKRTELIERIRRVLSDEGLPVFVEVTRDRQASGKYAFQQDPPELNLGTFGRLDDKISDIKPSLLFLKYRAWREYRVNDKIVMASFKYVATKETYFFVHIHAYQLVDNGIATFRFFREPGRNYLPEEHSVLEIVIPTASSISTVEMEGITVPVLTFVALGGPDGKTIGVDDDPVIYLEDFVARPKPDCFAIHRAETRIGRKLDATKCSPNAWSLARRGRALGRIKSFVKKNLRGILGRLSG